MTFEWKANFVAISVFIHFFVSQIILYMRGFLYFDP